MAKLETREVVEDWKKLTKEEEKVLVTAENNPPNKKELEKNVDDLNEKVQDPKKEEEEWKDEDEAPITVSWNVWMSNKWYDPMSWATISNDVSYSWFVSRKHKSWFWWSIFRISDMSKESPVGSITQLWVDYNKKFWLPKNWNLSVMGDVNYVDFDNQKSLREVMFHANLNLNNELFSIDLSALYNAYISWETPNSAVVKLQAALQATKTTNLSVKWRWSSNSEIQKQFYGAIWVNQQLPKWFSVWLEWLYKNKKPEIIVGLTKKF